MFLCNDCKKPKTKLFWCQNCNSRIFQQNFDKWTSGNDLIDKFIQNAQLNARNYNEVIEWIPYDHFRNILFLAHGGFSTVFKAIWLDGYIDKWDNKKHQWCRVFESLNSDDYENVKIKNVKSPLNGTETKKTDVILKRLNNSSNINLEVLNEVSNLSC